jgi:phosphate transport system permease protein
MTTVADPPEAPAEEFETQSEPPVIAPVDRPRAISARTMDDRLTLLGAGIASLCLVWLLFTQLLPLSGKLGFVVCWYVTFVALYAGITALSQPLPIVRDRIASALVHGGFGVVALALFSTVFFTLIKGWPAYSHLNFFTQDMSNAGPQNPLTQGGIKHALVGSLIQLSIAVAISLPLGVAAAVYMTEVGGRFSRIVRTVVEAMTALPDLVAGLFVYAFFIIALGQSRTGFAAGLALSITMLPIIARSSEVVLRVVPAGLREASLALGAPLWRTVLFVVLPTARQGLATALILGMARGVGETAPVLIVSAPSNYFNANPLHDPMNSLPLFVFNGVRAPDANSITRGYGAASVLLVLVIILFAVIRLLARRRAATR